MTKLFISYMALMARVKQGDVDEVDLDIGIFALGCSRSQAFAPFSESPFTVAWLPQDDASTQKRIHGIVTKALTKADAEGRVLWRDRGVLQSYKALNGLLDRNGFLEIPLEYVDAKGVRHDSAAYSCPGVAERVKHAEIDLDVVF